MPAKDIPRRRGREGIQRLPLNCLRVKRDLQLAFPVTRERFEHFRKVLAPLPLIITNLDYEIVFGMESYEALRKGPEIPSRIRVLCLDIADPEALLLNFNLTHRLAGVNLHEKLVFLQKIRKYLNPEEIREGAPGLDIPINARLVSQLDRLTSGPFKVALAGGRVTLKTAVSLSVLPVADARILLAFFTDFPFSHSYQRKIVEIMEELKFTYKSPVRRILKKAGISTRNRDSLSPEKVFQRLYALRYPRVTRREQAFQKEIKKFSLPENIRVSHPDFFEKNHLDVHIRVSDGKALAELLRKLRF